MSATMETDALVQKIAVMIKNFSMISKEIPLERLAQGLNISQDQVVKLIDRAVSLGKIYGSIIGYNFIWGESAGVSSGPKTSTPASKPLIFSKEAELEELQENLIDVEQEIGYVSGFLNYQIGILNQSNHQITQIHLKIDFPPDLQLIQVKPDFEFERKEKYARVHLPEVPPKNKQSMVFYFKPLTTGDFSLKGSIQFLNKKNMTRLKPVPPITSTLHYPTIILGKQLPVQEAQTELQQMPQRGIRSFGIPLSMQGNELAAFNHMKQLLQSCGFLMIGESDEGIGGKKVSWFHGLDQTTGQEYIGVGQVLNNKMEFFICSDDGEGVAGLLAFISKKMKDRMVSSHLIQDPGELVELLCPYCGGTLTHFPQPGENITCKWCNRQYQFSY